jgi:hypothetical protein
LRAAVAGLVDDAAIDRVLSPLTRLFGVASREEAAVDERHTVAGFSLPSLR